MKIVICCSNFTHENLRLMPWRYIHELAKGFQHSGHEISVVSIGNSNHLTSICIDGIEVFHAAVSDLFIDRMKRLKEFDYILWSSSPLTALYHRQFSTLGKPFILLFTGPFYSIGDVARAHMLCIPWKQLLTHYKNALVPLRWTKRLIAAEYVKSVVVLSKRNEDILKKIKISGDKVKAIPPGYEFHSEPLRGENSLEAVRERLALPHHEKLIIYLGSLYEIRGISILVKAFSQIIKTCKNVSLLVLARTERGNEINALMTQIKQLRIEGKAIIKSGILDTKTVQSYLYASDIIALPFVLVPSDMPVAALEAMSLGKPVITTDIDGMPEMIQGRGIVVKPGSVKELAEAIKRLSQDDELYAQMQRNCRDYMADYPSPEHVSQRFLALLNNHEQK